MKKLLLLAWLLIGLHSFTPTVEAKGAGMVLDPPELPQGYVWVHKIWLGDMVDNKLEITREPEIRWYLIGSPCIGVVFGSLFTLFVVQQLATASGPPKVHT